MRKEFPHATAQELMDYIAAQSPVWQRKRPTRTRRNAGYLDTEVPTCYQVRVIEAGPWGVIYKRIDGENRKTVCRGPRSFLSAFTPTKPSAEVGND